MVVEAVSIDQIGVQLREVLIKHIATMQLPLPWI